MGNLLWAGYPMEKNTGRAVAAMTYVVANRAALKSWPVGLASPVPEELGLEIGGLACPVPEELGLEIGGLARPVPEELGPALEGLACPVLEELESQGHSGEYMSGTLGDQSRARRNCKGGGSSHNQAVARQEGATWSALWSAYFRGRRCCWVYAMPGRHHVALWHVRGGSSGFPVCCRDVVDTVSFLVQQDDGWRFGIPGTAAQVPPE